MDRFIEKHKKNIVPIVGGVVFMAFLFIWAFCMAATVNSCTAEVKKEGLKSMLEEVWEGESKKEQP